MFMARDIVKIRQLIRPHKVSHPTSCLEFPEIYSSSDSVPELCVSRTHRRYSSTVRVPNHPPFPVPACMFLFGCVTIAQGFVKGYYGLLVTRFFLGLAETSVFSGCFYLISMYASRLPFQTGTLTSPARWYKRDEAQKRFTFFYCSSSLAGAFGGLLAYAISKLDGKGGLASWRWVFVIGTGPHPSGSVLL